MPKRSDTNVGAIDERTVAPELAAAIDGFLVHLTNERRLSAHSVAAYARDLRRLARWCGERRIGDWASFSIDDARSHAAYLHETGLSGRSIHRALSAGRTFFAWQRREHNLDHDPFAGVTAPKTQKKLPNTLTIEDVSRLVDSDDDDELAIRDRAMFELIYSSGLRLSELVAVDISDLDFGDAMLSVVGKGNKTRLVPVGRLAVNALLAWLRVRERLTSEPSGAMFVGRHGNRLGPRSVQKRLKRLSTIRELETDVNPHMLRHSFASHMLQSSGDLRAVQELLGHANISTTEVYTHLDYQHLAKVYDSAHPRARRRRGPKNDKNS